MDWQDNLDDVPDEQYIDSFMQMMIQDEAEGARITDNVAGILLDHTGEKISDRDLQRAIEVQTRKMVDMIGHTGPIVQQADVVLLQALYMIEEGSEEVTPYAERFICDDLTLLESMRSKVPEVMGNARALYRGYLTSHGKST